MDGSVLISLLYASHALETTRMFEWWRPGRDARFKKTEVCQTCSKLKNVCQVCLLDLEYGLPVQVRDTALAINSNDAIPKSDVNREYFLEEHDRGARAGIDYESSYGKVRANDTILKLQRTTPYYKRNRAHVCSFYVRGECTRGAECPYRHEMPITGELSQQNIKDRYYGVNDPVALKLLNKAGEMPSLVPPEDESIKTLYVGGLNERISEQDLRDQFYAHGEIESVRMVLQRACAFVTYTTREAAEKAAEELSNKLVIRGLRLKLLWGKSLAAKAELENHDDEAARQAALAHGGMLPRAVISQQQNQQVPPPGTQDQPPPMHYFNIPPPPPERAYYPSMDPQRMGALVPSQEASGSGPPPPSAAIWIHDATAPSATLWIYDAPTASATTIGVSNSSIWSPSTSAYTNLAVPSHCSGRVISKLNSFCFFLAHLLGSLYFFWEANVISSFIWDFH
ncbi:hypothetical protein Syun_018028 [Stephania yunnanensis]|uniref:Pre-mRNA-splicing factor RBM22 n=1 Tax=Stephania yunnanensis TaxID=152371 RepID=A0AAP0IRL0_9MAGN